MESGNLFASAQCLGYNGERGKLNIDMCNPSDRDMLSQMKRAVKRLRPKTVFVAADHNHMISVSCRSFPLTVANTNNINFYYLCNDAMIFEL